MTMWQMFQDLLAHPFTELDDFFLVAGGAEMTALAGKTAKDTHGRNQGISPGQILGAGPRSSDTGKSCPGHKV